MVSGKRSVGLRSCVVKLYSVNVMSANRIFGTLSIVKTANGPVLRLVRSSGKVEDTPLRAKRQRFCIGTTVFDVTLFTDGCRVKRSSGNVKFFHPSIVW